MRMKEAVSEFLALKRIAVTGVSRNPQGHGSNIVYQRLRDRGYGVFAVNPNADKVEGDVSYRDLKSIPGGVDAVVIGTRTEIAEDTMRECVDLGIHHVWMHRAFGEGSVSDSATQYGRERGINVIDGGCPCTFDPTADPGHKAMRLVFTLTGKSPDGSEPGGMAARWFNSQIDPAGLVPVLGGSRGRRQHTSRLPISSRSLPEVRKWRGVSIEP